MEEKIPRNNENLPESPTATVSKAQLISTSSKTNKLAESVSTGNSNLNSNTARHITQTPAVSKEGQPSLATPSTLPLSLQSDFITPQKLNEPSYCTNEAPVSATKTMHISSASSKAITTTNSAAVSPDTSSSANSSLLMTSTLKTQDHHVIQITDITSKFTSTISLQPSATNGQGRDVSPSKYTITHPSSSGKSTEEMVVTPGRGISLSSSDIPVKHTAIFPSLSEASRTDTVIVPTESATSDVKPTAAIPGM